MGTFVTVGNCTQSFKRLFEALAQIYTQLPQPIVIQAGHNIVDLPGCSIFNFVSQEQFDELIDSHELIISHAGVGTVLTALERGRKPIVVPRRSGVYAEHINDHQTAFAKELVDLDLITPIFATKGLAELILDASLAVPCSQPSEFLLNKTHSSYLKRFKSSLDQLSFEYRDINKMCLVSACGGHLTEIRKFKPVYQNYSVFHVINSQIVQSLDMQGKTHVITLCERDWRFLLNFWEAFMILLREKPDCIISTGSWPAIPFAVVGRILGIPNIYIETMARVTLPTLTGRGMYYLANRFLYPWHQLARFFPKGEYCGPLF